MHISSCMQTCPIVILVWLRYYIWTCDWKRGGEYRQGKYPTIIYCSSHKNVTELRGFLVIFTYYRNFVKGFSELAAPLSDLTKNKYLYWSEEHENVVKNMNKFMINCLVLYLLYFTQPFLLECDASREGIGVLLMQNRHPISFESRNFQPHERHYSINQK